MKAGKALDRMSELSVLAQDVTKSSADVALYNNEFAQLAAYITNSATMNFNDNGMASGGHQTIQRPSALVRIRNRC